VWSIELISLEDRIKLSYPNKKFTSKKDVESYMDEKFSNYRIIGIKKDSEIINADIQMEVV